MHDMKVNNSKKWSKNIDKRLHCRVAFMGETLTWHLSASAADKEIDAVA